MILSDVPEHIWLRTALFLGYVDAEDTHLQLLKHTLSLQGLWHRIIFIQLHMNYSTFHIKILHFFQPTRPNKMHQIQPDIMLISTGVSCRQQCSQQLLENRACLLYFFFLTGEAVSFRVAFQSTMPVLFGFLIIFLPSIFFFAVSIFALILFIATIALLYAQIQLVVAKSIALKSGFNYCLNVLFSFPAVFKNSQFLVINSPYYVVPPCTEGRGYIYSKLVVFSSTDATSSQTFFISLSFVSQHIQLPGCCLSIHYLPKQYFCLVLLTWLLIMS